MIVEAYRFELAMLVIGGGYIAFSLAYLRWAGRRFERRWGKD